MKHYEIEQHRMVDGIDGKIRRIRTWDGYEFTQNGYKPYSSEKRAMNSATKLCKKGLAFSDEIKITSYEIQELLCVSAEILFLDMNALAPMNY